MSKLKVCKDKVELGTIAGKCILAAAAHAIQETGRFVVAFSGGSLPSIIAPYVVSLEPLFADKHALPWLLVIGVGPINKYPLWCGY